MRFPEAGRKLRYISLAVQATFPLDPPIEPMLAKLAEELPSGEGVLYEPKWDGFRAIVFRGPSDVYIQSRDLRPLDRYFPDLHEALAAALPEGVFDGEIVIATPHGLDFDALQMRLHPAASRVAKLAAATPASFVAFDLLADARRDLRATPLAERRASLERLLAGVTPPIYLTPMTRDRKTATRLARAVRRRGSRWCDCETRGRDLRARQARDDQNKAFAHSRLRRRRFSLA